MINQWLKPDAICVVDRMENWQDALRIQQGVCFEAGENDAVRVIVMLSAVNGDEHLQMIAALAELFSDESRLQQLLSATSPAAIQAALTLNQQRVSS
ncbi:PTS sugar transporter subunit IIA [Candidatus Pantoea persica]|uniref:PTS sugar transporter subunit IIA n=1 Tax=Candidatus Pantoea persica TaxID=2518128 RepID=UPI00215DA7A4|nr:PTS sugar transporter subunit IIA [Candidatus Pantoea persica]MBA2817836.1 putative PTS system mannitol-specific transportersubunit IIA [Candidatus Pantoea persica]